jgi:hypothetical protein
VPEATTAGRGPVAHEVLRDSAQLTRLAHLRDRPTGGERRCDFEEARLPLGVAVVSGSGKVGERCPLCALVVAEDGLQARVEFLSDAT